MYFVLRNSDSSVSSKVSLNDDDSLTIELGTNLFPAGVITRTEIQALEDVNTPHGKWWVPIVWACNLIKQARKEGRIGDEFLMKVLMEVRT